MGEVNYAPLIDDMVWSYSRIKAFEDCPYRWYLKYIKKFHGKDMFFSSYGTFMHKLIELYHRKVFSSYFTGGLQYLKALQPFPYDVVGVEKKVDFVVNGIPFVGYIDFLGRKDDDLYVVDNKSRILKPRSSRAKPTKADEELDAYLRQLYIYSAAVEEEYGKTPKSLCFNCFRDKLFIIEPFKEQAYAESKEWLAKSIGKIREESDFKPSVEFFKCTHLCEMQDMCEYYELMRKR